MPITPHAFSRKKIYSRKTRTKTHTKTRTKTQSRKRRRHFTKRDYVSGDGMMTALWGPALWHFLHMISFNYPVHPTAEEKRNYRDFVKSLVNILPCKYCRQNLKKNLRSLPLTMAEMASRDTFSRYIYRLHERINTNLGKVSGLTFCDVRDRYEHFRARCTDKTNKTVKQRKSKKEKGCTTALHGVKGKCILRIVPKTRKCKTFAMDGVYEGA